MLDRRGGSRRMQRRGETWGLHWLQQQGANGPRAWLQREDAGTWWFEPSDPQAWATDTCTAADLALAERAVRGEFELLGAVAEPAATPAWRRDLYSGVEWPLEPADRLRVVRGDGSDIRTVWELSRCYHFTALARAAARTAEPRYADTFARHITSFIAQNPVGFGPHWASPMDVAIRSANWCLAVPLFAGADLPPAFWASMLGNLWSSGLFLERHLEWHPVYRGNHYVANLVGLAYLGTLFRGSRPGQRWLRIASRELRRELAYQVGEDGVALEASIAYHRLHTELFAWAGELLRRNVAGFDAAGYDAVIHRMVAFIGTTLQPDGHSPMVGDADDGRLHALDARVLAEPRRHDLGLPPRFRVPDPGDGAFAFAAGGFFVLRQGDHHATIRCGPVGLRGAGSHDHNDQLGFELVVGGRRIVPDSGSYVYTRDLTARHRFRSTAAHSVVQLDGAEQNPIRPDRPWRVLEDRTRSRALACEALPGGLRFAGEHRGYERLGGAICRREVMLDVPGGIWHIEDEVSGVGPMQLAWRLHLAGSVREEAVREPNSVRLVCPGDPAIAIEVHFPAGLLVAIEPVRHSHAYGLDRQGQVLVISGALTLPVRIHCRIHQESE
jgi:hypothetical protein